MIDRWIKSLPEAVQAVVLIGGLFVVIVVFPMCVEAWL